MIAIIVYKINRKFKKQLILVDDEWFEVYNINGDAYAVAKLLSEVNKFNVNFFQHLKRKYLTNIADKKRQDVVKMLLKNYNPNRLKDNLPNMYNKATAFVINKGEEYGICTRNDGKLHKLDTLLFVNLHELSHLSIHDLDHTQLFWNVFKLYLYEAKELLGRTIICETDYCGMEVHYNPLFDPVLDYFNL